MKENFNKRLCCSKLYGPFCIDENYGWLKNCACTIFILPGRGIIQKNGRLSSIERRFHWHGSPTLYTTALLITICVWYTYYRKAWLINYDNMQLRTAMLAF